MNVTQPVKKGDKVSYHIKRRTSAADAPESGIRDGWCSVRRVGTVKGRRDGKVVVQHADHTTDLVHEADLYLLG
ncbi:hypothetical protein [Pigmentiphaga sp. CHJ604]|uniref:hypothetical protein n=1 Tax=Pigmentiphaga sp. CHJ604 TaxID=3081984 RepID=UPI0030D359CF